MEINRIEISNFGKFHDFQMDFGDDLNVICEKNGWGKSTLAAFIKAMFYGLRSTRKRSLEENERIHYTPWQGGTFGGSMEFTVGDKSYRVVRTFGSKDREDTFALYDKQSGMESRDYTSRLGEELFSLDMEAFERSSFFMQSNFAPGVNDSMNAVLTHMEEEAGDMGNYDNAVMQLEKQKKELKKKGNNGKLAEWAQELSETQRKLNCCHGKEGELKELGDDLKAEESKKESLEHSLQDAAAYGEKKVRKELHDHLKEQAAEQERKCKETASRLEQTKPVLEEEELGRLSSQLYDLENLESQNAGSTSDVNDPYAASSGNGGKVLFIFAAIAAVAAVILLVLKMVLPGVVLAAAAIALVCIAVWQRRRKEQKRKHQEMADRTDALRGQLCRSLQMHGDPSVQEMRDRWQSLYQQCIAYGSDLESYERQREDAAESRRRYEDFCGRYTDEELEDILNAAAPEQDKQQLDLQLNETLQEIERIGYDIRILTEQAEKIPELEEENNRLDRLLEEGNQRYDLLEKTVDFLEQAKEQFSARYLGTLEKSLKDYLAELEPGEGQDPELNVDLVVDLKQSGIPRELGYFSTGWQELVYIAERLAIVDALYQREEPVLVLDDTFSNLDDEKQERAVALLNLMAQKRQIIYFTCHAGGLCGIRTA